MPPAVRKRDRARFISSVILTGTSSAPDFDATRTTLAVGQPVRLGVGGMDPQRHGCGRRA